MTIHAAEDIAAEVRVLLARRQIRQAVVAGVLGLSPMAMSRRLRGEVSFTAEEIYALAEFLEVDLAEFLPSTSADSDHETSPAATTGAAAPHVDVALAGETADGQGSAGQSGKARDQRAAASTRAFPAIAETRD